MDTSSERVPHLLDTDAEIIDAASKLHTKLKGNRQHAVQTLFASVLVLAHIDDALPGAVMERLVRIQPSRFDQMRLMNRLGEKIGR